MAAFSASRQPRRHINLGVKREPFFKSAFVFCSLCLIEQLYSRLYIGVISNPRINLSQDARVTSRERVLVVMSMPQVRVDVYGRSREEVRVSSQLDVIVRSYHPYLRPYVYLSRCKPSQRISDITLTTALRFTTSIYCLFSCRESSATSDERERFASVNDNFVYTYRTRVFSTSFGMCSPSFDTYF